MALFGLMFLVYKSHTCKASKLNGMGYGVTKFGRGTVLDTAGNCSCHYIAWLP